MLRTNIKQRGSAGFWIALSLGFVALLVSAAMILVPIWMEYDSLKSAVDVASKSITTRSKSEPEIMSDISKQLRINQISIPSEQVKKMIKIKKQGSIQTVTLNYEKYEPWFGNVYIGWKTEYVANNNAHL